jgi:hypothetical protein
VSSSNKHPYIPLYTGDWLKDAKLSICSPATRGIWIDIICAIHEADNGGSVIGTPRELARLCRADSSEVESAILELEKSSTADIERQLDGSVKITCRRIQRHLSIKQKRSEAGSKGGAKSKQRENSPDYENEDEGLGIVREFCKGIGIGEGDADWFFWKCHANGWKNAGQPILDWRGTIRSWHRAGYLPSQKAKQNGSKMQAKPPTEREPKIEREMTEARRKYGSGVTS